MLENQINLKSSETTGVHPTKLFSTPNCGKVYFDTAEAVADFEAETQNPRPAGSFLHNARVLMRHGEYSLALKILRQASNMNSKCPKTLNLLASCLEKMARTEEELVVRKALTHFDYGFTSLFQYASALYRSELYQESLDISFEALAVLNEEDVNLFELYKNMGNIFVRRGDFDGAEEYYNKAYTMNSQSDVLLVNLGTLEVQRNDFEKSLYCFRKAVEINSRNDKAWVGLAMVHNQLGDFDLAWANIEAALDISPGNRTAVHLTAHWGLRDSKLQKAIEALQIYLGGVEQDEDMSLVLINLFCLVGDMEAALIEMERVLLWNPDHAEVRQLRKKILTAQKVA